MSSEKSQAQNQMEFSTKERSKAELWAWLTEGHAVSANSEKTRSERKIIVLSKDTVKSAIREALSNNDSQRAQELLDVASKPDEGLSQSMTRKSVRVSPGEYVKLLYLKMKERTSFADVMMKVLNAPCKKMVEELSSQFREKQLPATDRINHLLKVIESWESEKPESRASIAEWGDWTKSSYRLLHKQEPRTPANEWERSELPIPVETRSYTMITPYYRKPALDQKYLEQVKAAFCRLALTDLMIKAAGGDLSKPVSGLFYEFKDEWIKEIENEPFLKKITLHAFIENEDEKQELYFSIYFKVTTFFSAEQEIALFSKYGEEAVNDFIERVKYYPGGTKEFLVNGRYEGITNSELYKESSASSLLGEHRFDIMIGTELDLTCCKITARGADDFASDWPQNLPPILENYRQQFESMLQKVAEKVGTENTYREEPTYLNLACEAGRLIPKAIDKASTPEDYREINNLLTLKNLYDDYRTIIDFVDEITRSTLNHHSVVSFYINSDLWRIVPLVLERTNWITLVEEYLKEKSMQTEKTK